MVLASDLILMYSQRMLVQYWSNFVDKKLEMRYLKTVKECTRLDSIKNEYVRKELNINQYI
jgi:hypothetical protein